MDAIDDDLFKAELYVTFYREALGHCDVLRGAVAAVRDGGCAGTGGDVAAAAAATPRTVRDAAHALKGSAATLQLSALSSAAAALEVAALRLLASAPGAAPSAAGAAAAALRALCLSPAAELRALLRELRAYVRFFLDWVAALEASMGDVAAQLPAAEADILRAASPAHFEAAVLAPFAALGVDVDAAA